jgi:hypothetical protein
MYECMYVCMYVCDMYICMHVCVCVCMYMCVYVCMYVCMYVCVCVYVCMYVCVCMYMSVCLSRLPLLCWSFAGSVLSDATFKDSSEKSKEFLTLELKLTRVKPEFIIRKR